MIKRNFVNKKFKLTYNFTLHNDMKKMKDGGAMRMEKIFILFYLI